MNRFVLGILRPIVPAINKLLELSGPAIDRYFTRQAPGHYVINLPSVQNSSELIIDKWQRALLEIRIALPLTEYDADATNLHVGGGFRIRNTIPYVTCIRIDTDVEGDPVALVKEVRLGLPALRFGSQQAEMDVVVTRRDNGDILCQHTVRVRRRKEAAPPSQPS